MLKQVDKRNGGRDGVPAGTHHGLCFDDNSSGYGMLPEERSFYIVWIETYQTQCLIKERH
jgi:hypothetical protein